MKLLFNKNGIGTAELQKLTGSYYENNDFAKIETDLLLETEEIIKMIGEDVYQLAEDFYYADDSGSSPDQQIADLVQHIQLPISLMAAYRYYQLNIMSHEDGGRKLKVDKDHESTPWEWMFDRDDAAHLRKAYHAIDRLIRFLDKCQFAEWVNSDAQKATRKLFINNTKAFNDIYPIDDSPRFYYAVLPFIAEVQRTVIYKALGKERFDTLLQAFQSLGNESGSSPAELDEADETLINLIQQAMPLLTMAIAVKRLSLKVLPEGVVQQFKSMLQGRSASQPALPGIIAQVSEDLICDAQKAITELQRELRKATPEDMVYNVVPKNDENNKYFSF